jgi:hypothetical protein
MLFVPENGFRDSFTSTVFKPNLPIGGIVHQITPLSKLSIPLSLDFCGVFF